MHCAIISHAYAVLGGNSEREQPSERPDPAVEIMVGGISDVSLNSVGIATIVEGIHGMVLSPQHEGSLFASIR